MAANLVSLRERKHSGMWLGKVILSHHKHFVGFDFKGPHLVVLGTQYLMCVSW